MSLRSIRRAVSAAAILETVELRRLLSVGPDTTFGTSGDGMVVYEPQVNGGNLGLILTAQNASTITTVANVYGGDYDSNDLLVSRFSTNGTPISSNVVSLDAVASTTLVISDVLVDSANTTYIAGTIQSGGIGFVVRINADGNVMSNFAGTGAIITSPVAQNSLSVELVANGGLIYAAYAVTGVPDVQTGLSQTSAEIIAFDSSGAIDPTYGTQSVALLAPGTGAKVNELFVDGSGLLVVGSFEGRDSNGPLASDSLYVARITDTGDLDTGFANGGFGTTAETGLSDVRLSAVVRLPVGFAVAGTDGSQGQFIAKIAANYALDSNFDGDGVLPLNAIMFTPTDVNQQNLTADAAGNLYATGQIFGTEETNMLDLGVVRIKPTGVLDETFDGDGVFVLNQTIIEAGYTVTTTPSGAILVSGSQFDEAFVEHGLLLQLAEPNTAPVVGTLVTEGSVETNVSTSFSINFSDDDAGDTFTFAWDFGDSTPPVVGAASPGTVNASHTYAAAGTYEVSFTVTDSAGHAVTKTGSITVIAPNVAPVVAPLTGPATAATGTNVNFASSFSDANPGDTFTAAWNFGDGNTLAPAPAVQGGVAASHTYVAAGTYTVTLTITDSAGHAVSTLKTITVTAPPIVPYTFVGGKLSVTAAGTTELVKSGANYVLTVGSSSYTITGAVNSAVITGGTGNDFIRVSTQITIPVTLIGGAGNDTLRGGSGDDVIIGDEGNDLLIGRDGQDLMIGGNGADFLIGREDADILISGTTSLSSNLAALSSVMAEWTSNHNILVKLANVTGILPLPGRLNGNFYLTPNVTVFNDNNVDTLSGGDGADLYYISLFGLNSDIIRDNQNAFAANIATLVFGD